MKTACPLKTFNEKILESLVNHPYKTIAQQVELAVTTGELMGLEINFHYKICECGEVASRNRKCWSCYRKSLGARKIRFSEDEVEKIKALRDKGWTYVKIAQYCKCSAPYVRIIIKHYKQTA